jgi:hypothetical protein
LITRTREIRAEIKQAIMLEEIYCPDG